MLLVGIFFLSPKSIASAAGAWIPVGKVNLSETASDNTYTVLDNNGVPYVAYSDISNTYKLSVKKFDGNSWISVGSKGFSALAVTQFILYFDASNTPYALYGEGTKITISRFNGSAWETVNTVVAGTIFTNIDYSSFSASSDAIPYIAFNSTVTGKTSVYKYNGSAWVAVGNTSFSPGSTTFITSAIDKLGRPYVAFKDVLNANKITVMKFDADSWSIVGTAGFSTNNLASLSNLISLSFDSENNPYVLYSDPTLSYKMVVKKFDGSSWTTIGATSSPSVSRQSLKFDKAGVPYVSFVNSVSTKLNILKYNGSSWIQFGPADFANNPNVYSVDFSSQNIPYVSYVNPVISQGVTMLRLTDNAEIYYSGDLNESSLNNGSVIGTSSANLVNKNFVNGGSNLVEGVHYTISNKPAGLTPTISINVLADKADLSFSGSATYHGDENDVSNLTINFLDSSFSGGNAAGVLNSSTNNNIINFFSKPYASRVNLSMSGIVRSGSNNSSLAVDSNNVKYFAYSNGGTLMVKKYDGNSWLNTGTTTAGVLYATNAYESMAINSNNIPYVAYKSGNDSGKATVVKLNGAVWENVGNPGFSLGAVDYVDIAINSVGVPYVAYRDAGRSSKVTVMKFNGTAWESVGIAGFSTGTAADVNIEIDSHDIPYIAYIDGAAGGRASVMKFENNAWSNVGTAGFSSGVAYSLGFDLSSTDAPYVVYGNNASNKMAQVMWFNGSSWSLLGSGFASPSYVYDPFILLSKDDVPYIVYSDGSQGEKQSVRRFVSGAWEDVGLPGLSTGKGYNSSMAFDKGGNIFVSYDNWSNSNTAVDLLVMPPVLSNLSSKIGKTKADLVWEVSSGGSNILGFVVKYKTPIQNTWTLFSDLINNPGATITGLSSGTQYESEVSAFNSLGVNSEPLWTSLLTSTFAYKIDNFFATGVAVKSFSPLSTQEPEGVYAISPEPPLGLVFDTKTGAINGAPEETWLESTRYTVTYTSAAGVETATFNIKVNDLDSLGFKRFKSKDMNKLADRGIVSAVNGEASSTKTIKFNEQVTVMSSDGASIVIPSDLTMTAGQSFETSALVVNNADTSDLKAIVPAGTVKFGLPDLGLDLSEAVTITIPVSGFSDGTILSVYRKSAGETWLPLTTCSVTADNCIFETTHLSEFAAGPIVKETKSNDTINSGSLPLAPVCTSVTYSEFSAQCSNGYQYRNYLNTVPAQCSMTATQIEAGRRLCAETNNNSTLNKNTELKKSRNEFVSLEKTLVKKVNKALSQRLAGRILLQVEDRGQAWYLNPSDQSKYFLGSPADAYSLMRTMALGINNKTFDSFKDRAPAKLAGRILLKVEDGGKAYYVDPINLKINYLGSASDAFKLMRSLGLGILNSSLRQIETKE